MLDRMNYRNAWNESPQYGDSGGRSIVHWAGRLYVDANATGSGLFASGSGRVL